MAGVELLDIDIKTVKQWVMDAQVANRYLSNNQRIVLAGDAAHRFPPAGGFGITLLNYVIYMKCIFPVLGPKLNV